MLYQGESTFEGVFSEQRVVEDHSDRPDIRLVVIGLVLYHFWSHEVDCSTACFRCIFQDFG